jgi:ring-1,2-phenylacetyl-CoA epoxidase subunit PaaC
MSDRQNYALRLADDALVLSHRLADWSSRAHDLEEDIALTNIALDLLGQARELLTYAGEIEGLGRGEDALAYLRTEHEFLSCLLVEQPNDDFGVTMARQLYFSTYQHALYQRLLSSTDERFSAIATKALKEVEYHRQHAASWVIRLGDGTDESRRRMQRGLERLWPFVGELFEADEVTGRLASGIGVDPASLQPEWDAFITSVLAEATLTRPDRNWLPGTGRKGRHSEHLGYMLAEMQYLHRLHPGATW